MSDASSPIFPETDYEDLLPEEPQQEEEEPKWEEGPSFEDIEENSGVGKSLSAIGKKPFYLAKINDIPETRTVMRSKCWRVFGKKICTDLPTVQKRDCDKRFYVDVYHPDVESISTDIQDCIKISGAAAIAILISTGNIALATTTLKGAMYQCLVAKGVQKMGEFGIGIRVDRRCGSWRNVS